MRRQGSKLVMPSMREGCAVRCYTTDLKTVCAQSSHSFYRDDDAEFGLVACYPDRTYQQIVGFGAALTESSAYVFAQMPEPVQDEFLRLTFGDASAGWRKAEAAAPLAGFADGNAVVRDLGLLPGNGYNLARTHIQSCDFSLGSYAHVVPFDKELRSFSIERDKQLLVPFLRCCLVANDALRILAAPWSPPAFMKNIPSMKHGGRLKRNYYGNWAQMLVRYVQAYRAEGVPIAALSVQNEPMASQDWESCLFSAAEELEFAGGYLRPALDAAGLGHVKLFAWDHNKDRVFERAMSTLGADPEVFDGVAFHGYAGDHFEELRAVSEAFPSAALLFTEGCMEYVPDWRTDVQRSVRKAERYAHEIMGDLNAGACGFIDWNVLLDEQGGPNHVGNFCEATLMYDSKREELCANRSFVYIGHFSRYVKPGARRFLASRYTDRIECVGFVNPDGTRVLVVLNRTGASVKLRIAERPYVADCPVSAHSISTFTWAPDELS